MNSGGCGGPGQAPSGQGHGHRGIGSTLIMCYCCGEHGHYASSGPYLFKEAHAKLVFAQEGSVIHEAQHFTTGTLQYDDSTTDS